MEKIKEGHTIFCDFDGTIFYHSTETIIPGTKEKFTEWNEKGYTIIITTARPSSLKDQTLRALDENGLLYHAIIFDLGNGSRFVLNDKKNGNERAFGINVERDKGIENVEI